MNRAPQNPPASAPPAGDRIARTLQELEATLAGASGSKTYTITVPRTQQDIRALRERRSELSNQLESAASRRANVANDLKLAEGAVKTGLEQRMAVLDKRILQLESDIAETGQQLTSAPAGLIAATETPLANLGINPNTIEKVSIMFTLFVLAPLAVSAAYLMFRRAFLRPGAPRDQRADGGERLERLESAVDAIALEIERISEGQRFVTRLLTEAAPPSALSAGKAGQIAARRITE